MFWIIGILCLQTLFIALALNYARKNFKKLVRSQDAIKKSIGKEAELARQSSSELAQSLHSEIRIQCEKHHAELLQFLNDDYVPVLVNRTAHAVRELNLFRDLDSSLLPWRVENHPDRHLHLVYGPPKTGNTTLLATLWANSAIADSAMSAHFLSERVLDHRYAVCSNIKSSRLADLPQEYWKQYRVNKVLKQFGYLASSKPDTAPVHARLNVITGIRDPIATVISLLFYRNSRKTSAEERIDIQTFLNLNKEVNPLIDSASIDLFHFQQEWMRIDFKDSFGFDPVSLPFDPEKGYHVHDTERHRFLFVRLEHFSSLPQILGDFYNINPESITIQSENRAASREDAEAYSKYVSEFKLPRAKLDELYSTPFATTFFSAEERQKLIEKWSE